MFSSNQIFDITCAPRDLAAVLAFGIDLADDAGECLTRADGRVRMAFSTPAPGVYAIGYGSMRPFASGPNKGWSRDIPDGWTDYSFDYDPTIVALIITQWLSDNPPDPAATPVTDGSVKPGVRVRCPGMRDDLPTSDWDKLAALLIFEPCWLTYDK